MGVRCAEVFVFCFDCPPVQPDDFIKEVPQGMEKNDLVVVKGFFYPEGNR